MTGRLRYVIALAFVALYILVPEADHVRIAYLQTRDWMTRDGGPLQEVEAKYRADHLVSDPEGTAFHLPTIRTMVRISTGLSERTDESWDGDFARITSEYARQKDHPVDLEAPPMGLEVIVGDTGFRSTFHSATTEPMTFEQRRAQDGGVYYPDRTSLLPAFLAIGFAILTGWVIPSLLIGCLVGAWLYRPAILDALHHLTIDTLWQDVLGRGQIASGDGFNLRIVGFVVLLFMMVGVITRAGGILGMIERVQRYAKGPFSAQTCSFVTGLLIFFDDYSNCVIAGTTMRPLTDRNHVSREKLSYIVDSTAAPVAGISIFSTWVSYEVSMFAPQLPEVTRADGSAFLQTHGYEVFVDTLPFRFYCVFTLVTVLLTILLRREFGGMLRAERRAIHEDRPVAADATPLVSASFDRLEPPPGIPLRARNALVPIAVLIATTVGITLYQGIDNANTEWSLLWASLAALIVAGSMALVQRILGPKDIAIAALRSARSLGFAIVILLLAWTIGKICEDLDTSVFLIAAFQQHLTPWLLPGLLFLISALVAFCTGTSYGTMAILLPNVVVLAHTTGMETEIGGTAMMFLSIGAVLEGSIFGDHCSPISDTTVLSSVATGCDHMHHVRTQAPYAVLAMVVALVCGYLPLAVLGTAWWPVSWLVAILALMAWLRFVGRDPRPRIEV